ncbi:MAG: hypothetical protein AB7V55_06895 [Oscillospiraceae bacterium]
MADTKDLDKKIDKIEESVKADVDIAAGQVEAAKETAEKGYQKAAHALDEMNDAITNVVNKGLDKLKD